MKVLIITIIFLCALFLQTSFFALPFVLISVLLLGVIYKEAWIFPVGFFAGIFLDILSFHTVGESSLFFTVMLGIVYVYQRKFEIQTLPFLFSATFLSILLYSPLIMGFLSFPQALFAAGIAAGCFWLYTLISFVPSRSRIRNYAS